MRLFSNAGRIISLITFCIFFASCSTTGPALIETEAPKTYKKISIHFIDVGQGDSTLVELPDGGNMLIDAGSPAAGPGLVKYLRSAGIKHIDHLVFTHPHDDHIGGVFNILSEFEVGKFYDNGFSNFGSTIYGDYLKSVRGDLVKYKVLQAGEKLSFGELGIEVLNPLLPPTGDLNDDSIVLRLHYGDVRVLIPGDMGNIGERRLLSTGTELKSHVLKVGHHGADDACSEEFLAATAPKAAVITVSAVDKYARPENGALGRLEDAGIKVYRTDRNGHIVLKTDGVVFSMHTERSLNGEMK
jgi:competence protein ComEC